MKQSKGLEHIGLMTSDWRVWCILPASTPTPTSPLVMPQIVGQEFVVFEIAFTYCIYFNAVDVFARERRYSILCKRNLGS